MVSISFGVEIIEWCSLYCALIDDDRFFLVWLRVPLDAAIIWRWRPLARVLPMGLVAMVAYVAADGLEAPLAGDADWLCLMRYRCDVMLLSSFFSIGLLADRSVRWRFIGCAFPGCSR